MGMGTGRAHSSRRPFLPFLIFLGVTLVLWLRFGRSSSGSGGSGGSCDLNAYSKDMTTELDLKHCKLTELPSIISQFKVLKKLDVSHNALTDLPTLPASLEVLFCLGNPFEDIPVSVTQLPALHMLSFKSCRLKTLGAKPLPSTLDWLILTDNELVSLPADFGYLTMMRKLMLANNRLTSLPESMSNMGELELLRLANNQLSAIPPFILSLPKLTWLAVAGNPCIAPAPARASLATVSMASVRLGDKLGEGTSSVVRKGEWHGQTVAVKVYKAQLSSDGKNIDEVRASCAVDHPNVLRWLGYVEEGASTVGQAHATASDGGGAWRLVGVLEWAPGFRSLGKPPSMTTITRDTYPEKTAFSGDEIVAIAKGIAAALAHLHERGLSHGDVYAHNILWRRGGGDGGDGDDDGGRPHPHQRRAPSDGAAATAKLADFGAAFFYGAGSADAPRYEQMEQRAYGLLLEELLARHDGTTPHLLGNVRAVADAATMALPEERPGFAKLSRMLTEKRKGRELRRPRGTFGRAF